MNTNISPLNSQILFSLLSMSIALPMLSATAAVAGVPPSVALDDSPDVCEADCKAPDDWDDPYKALYNECCYITFASMSGANDIVIDQDTPGYGAVNQWRIGKDTKDKRADSVNPGTSAIAMIGLLYGYNRLVVQDKSSTDLDCRVKTTLRSFFHNWIRNSDNQIVDNNGRVGFPNDKPWATEYDIEGNLVNKNTEANAGATSELIMAMAHYVEHSPNNDGADHQSESYDLAYKMAQYVAHNSNLGSWTHDRSYAVAAFTAFANWADAMGDAEIASSYRNKADDIVYLLEKAKDHGTTSPSWYNFFNYLDSGGKGVYLNADQTGFAPYEFNTRDACEPFADRVGESWDYGRYGGPSTGASCQVGGCYMTVQSGPYAGGVHQTTASYERIYPGPSFQLADAEWKMGRVDKALWHYEAAMSPVGSAVGLGCRVVDDTYDDGFVGGFIDWVVDDGDPPPPPHIWQRFVDTSAYMIVATEELFFDNEVDWSLRGRIFDDVPITYWAWPHIDAIAEAGITTGCGPDLYCPENLVSRAEMAVFLLRGIYRIRCYTPPEPTGTRFSDVPASFWATAWIEQLAAEGITQGCGGGRYCPNNTVTRAEMAVFLLRSKHGSGYQPPPATGTEFKDVPRSHWAAAWIEQLAAEEITGGCGNGNYCPDNSVTRAQMAVFLARTFNLPLP